MKINQTTTNLQVTIAFQLKDLFKSSFKTAKWNAYNKTWDIANNQANKNKLAKFQEALDTTQVEDPIKLNEEVEMLHDEFLKLKVDLLSIKSQISEIEELRAKHEKLKNDILEVCVIIDAKKIEVGLLNDSATQEKKNNENKLNEILSLYNLDGMTVQSAIDQGAKYFNYMKASYKGNNLDKFQEIQDFLTTTYNDIVEKFGIEFNVMHECGRANKNRHDRDYCWFTEEVTNPLYIKFPE